MADQPLEEMLPRTNWSTYTLVRMAALRALELADGKSPLVERETNEKLTTIALREIVAGKVESKENADLRASKSQE